jgi:hypothetical protein
LRHDYHVAGPAVVRATDAEAVAAQGAEAVSAVTLPADIFFTRGTSLVSRAIRVLTRHIGESRTQVNHVGLIVGSGLPVADATLVEAVRGVRVTTMPRYADARTAVAVYRRRLDAPDRTPRRRIADRGLSYVGKRYGYGKILLHALDWCLLGAFVFRRLGRMDRYPICSWLVACSYSREADITFGIDSAAASPDDIWDYVTTHPDEWTCVRSLAPL